MKHILIILIAGMISLPAISQRDDLLNKTQNLIIQCMEYKDFNPMHKPETDTVVNILKRNVSDRDTENLVLDYNKEIQHLFRLIYQNAENVYEDSPDYRRKKIRRAYCYASLALVSHYNKAYTFLEYAELSIMEDLDKPDFELLEGKLLGIYLIDLMLQFEENQLRKKQIQSVQQFLEAQKENINSKIYDESKELLQNYINFVN